MKTRGPGHNRDSGVLWWASATCASPFTVAGSVNRDPVRDKDPHISSLLQQAVDAGPPFVRQGGRSSARLQAVSVALLMPGSCVCKLNGPWDRYQLAPPRAASAGEFS